MAPVTQVEAITLKPAAADAKRYEQSIAEFVRTAVPRAAHFATSIEKPSSLWTFIEWDSLEALQSKQNDSFQNQLSSLRDTSGFASSAQLKLDSSQVFNDAENPVVEVLNMCFPADIDDGGRSTVDTQFKDFADKALRVPAMCGSITQGWTTEVVPLPGEEDKSGRILVSLISWPCVERHMENRETQAFKDSVHLLRGLPGLVKLDVFHVKCKTV